MSSSKTKNIISKETKFLSNCSLSTTSTEGRLISINEKYLAMAWKYKGEMSIIDINSVKSSNINNLTSTSDKSNILDLEFSPFDTNILALSNENNSVIVSKLIDNNQKINIDKYDIYKKHSSKVNFVNFNPVASNIICSSTLFREVHIWDSIKYELYKELPKLENNPISLLWAPNGTLIGITTKKGFLNVFDMREKDYIIKSQLSGLGQNSKMTFNWLDDNNIAILGHNSKNERILSLFDIRNQNQKTSEYSYVIIDKRDTPAFPFIDRELKLIYTVGKDNAQINIYDYSKSTLKKLSHSAFTSEPNICSALFPRKFLDKKNNEIDRIFRANHNNIYYTSFKIHNERSSGFEGELYPNPESGKPLFTHESWKEKIEKEANNKIIINDNNNMNKGPSSERKSILNQNMTKDLKNQSDNKIKVTKINENKEKPIKEKPTPNTANKAKVEEKIQNNKAIKVNVQSEEKKMINIINSSSKKTKEEELKKEKNIKIEEFKYSDEKELKNTNKNQPKENVNISKVVQNLDKNKSNVQKKEVNEKLLPKTNNIKIETPERNNKEGKVYLSNKKLELNKEIEKNNKELSSKKEEEKLILRENLKIKKK